MWLVSTILDSADVEHFIVEESAGLSGLKQQWIKSLRTSLWFSGKITDFRVIDRF